jgi:hypothetical protein
MPTLILVPPFTLFSKELAMRREGGGGTAQCAGGFRVTGGLWMPKPRVEVCASCRRFETYRGMTLRAKDRRAAGRERSRQ